MTFILGTKLKMSIVFNKEGKAIPVTMVKAGPARIVDIKTPEKDGYSAVQLAFGAKKIKNLKKPQRKKLEKPLSKEQGFCFLKEFRVKQEELKNYKLGEEIGINVFKEGDMLKIRGISKGKGFQGVVKRWGFHGGPRTHGQKHSEREAGSIGSKRPGPVAKGKKMAGRMGGEKITIRNLKIETIDAKNSIMAIKGAIPGNRGTLVEIRS